MESVTRFLTGHLRLKVDASKSAVGRPKDRKFLGFRFTWGRSAKASASGAKASASGATTSAHGSGRTRGSVRRAESTDTNVMLQSQGGNDTPRQDTAPLVGGLPVGTARRHQT